MELLRLEKAPRSSSPTFNHIPSRPLNHQGPHVLSSWMVTLHLSWQPLHCLTTLTMKKFSLISKTTAPHYCQTSSAIHAPVWREREALQGQWIGAGRSWEQRHPGFQPCLYAGWSVGAWGLSQGVPKGPEVPQQLRIGICRWDISRERRHRCPNICRNRGAPGLPAHPQEPHSQSDLKSHSWGRAWSFLLRVQGKTAHSWLCSLPRAQLLVGLNHFKSCFCCTWWAHPKFTTLLRGSW